MFTGIIEERGVITGIEPSGDGARLTVRAPLAVSDAGRGDSISIGGVCLTVTDRGEDWFTADVMKQTLDVSTLGALGTGDEVNVERALGAHARLGGHIVRPGAQWRVIRVGMPAALAPLVVDKGSIALQGVSLTVSAVSAADPSTSSGTGGASSGTGGAGSATGTGGRHWFEVSLIPETLDRTTLGALAPGDLVNLETDIMARHVQRLLAFTTTEEGGSA
jgi:riboflavin synthase